MKGIKIVLLIIVIISMHQCKLEPFVEGKMLYDAYCSTCHMEDGSGLKGIYPALTPKESIILSETHLSCMIRFGPDRNKDYTGAAMPPNPKLSEIEISNIVNYVETQFFKHPSIDIKEIRKELAACSGNE